MTRSNRRGADDQDPHPPDGIHATFDWSSTSPTEAVVRTVAIAADVEPTGIDPIYDSVDPDVLDALVGPAADGSRSFPIPVTVTFPFAGHDVTVRSDGTVVVRPESGRK